MVKIFIVNNKDGKHFLFNRAKKERVSCKLIYKKYLYTYFNILLTQTPNPHAQEVYGRAKEMARGIYSLFLY